MGGPRFAVAIAFAALTGVACQKTGGYTLTWSFETVGDAPAVCGARGVDAIRVTGSSTEGDGENVTAVCAAGGITHGVPIGTWTFMVHQLDVRGREIVVWQVDADGKPVTDTNGANVPVPNPTTAPTTIGEDATVPFETSCSRHGRPAATASTTTATAASTWMIPTAGATHSARTRKPSAPPSDGVRGGLLSSGRCRPLQPDDVPEGLTGSGRSPTG